VALSNKRRIIAALAVSAALALVLIGAAIAFFPPNSGPTASCETAMPGIPPACTNCNNASPDVSCPYIISWTFLKSGVVQFDVIDQGQSNITLSSATISGTANDSGFTGSVTFSLNDTTIAPNSNGVSFSSPVLHDLQVGDHVTITVRTTDGTYFARSVVV
jgi:hypothetical protein